MTKNILEVSMLLIAVVCAIGGVKNQITLKKGMGVRFIQYLGLTVLVPIVAMLALEGRNQPRDDWRNCCGGSRWNSERIRQR